MIYRPNVGICLINENRLIFAGKRVNIEFFKDKTDSNQGWQMPQGGVASLEDEEILEQGMYRELWEEIGLLPKHVQILKKSEKVKYTFTKKVRESLDKNIYGDIVGQEQIWFYLKFIGKNRDFCLVNDEHPEFSEWRWAPPQFLLDNVMDMKKEVYRKVLAKLNTL